MAEPLPVIVRFRGDPDDLLEHFERARRLWIEAHGSGYEQPIFYATCRTRDGIAIVTCWENAAAHRAFGQGMHRQIDAVRMRAPDEIEHMRIEKLGWD